MSTTAARCVTYGGRLVRAFAHIATLSSIITERQLALPLITQLAAPGLTVMRFRHPWRWTIGGLAAIVLSAAAFLYYHLTEAFRGDYETIRVVQMVEDYVRTHDGKWPSSWEDLEDTEMVRHRDLDLSYFRRYTTIDFTLTSEQLLEKPERIYNAVTPASGEYVCYPNARRDLDRVLQAIRDARERR